jgi:hypothetical protein
MSLLSARKRLISLRESSRGKNHAGDAERAGEPHALGAADGHLGAGVQLLGGAHGAGQQGHRGVLHDERVDPRGTHVAQDGLEGFELGLEDECVEGKTDFGPRAVTLGHHRGQLGPGDAGGPGAGVEAVAEAEVDGVGAGGQGSAEGGEITGRSQDFRTLHGRSH